ncbi:MAG: D-aminoacylase [Opitutus sp.]|nr:D-aminoacylase [Opitutus sp.]
MKSRARPALVLLVAAGFGGAPAAVAQADYDVILRHGTIYDGSGGKSFVGDVAIKGDRIAAVGTLGGARAAKEIDVTGLAVAPGFINMLSQSATSLLQDGRSQSEIRQGVTLEVMGEGGSMGPLNDEMKAEMTATQGDIKFAVDWTTLGEYLTNLERRGVSCNVASFIGAATPRVHELGKTNRPPTPAELARMQALVRQAMEEGAMGVSTGLIYVPGVFAKTDELIALCRAASPYGGIYISHLRSEGDRLMESLDELITIAREANLPAEVFHLKMAGKPNWPKLDEVVKKIEAAHAAGLKITADMYNYTAGSTGLDAAMPPWVQEGGYKAWAARLRDPVVRERVRREMNDPQAKWENYFLAPGSPDKILLVGFKNDALKIYTGKTLGAVAKLRGTPPEDTAMDLVIEDGSRVQCVYFLMSEENVKQQIALPWMAFCSDSASMAPEGVFLKSSTHPRAYGSFARLLGKYVRDEKVIPLEEAVRRLSLFPAENLKIKERGALRPGWFADVVVFDPAKIQDHATYDQPHQYATGMVHVLVNGVPVLRDGEHTGAKPGRFVRGPGWKPKS